jgi:hypothetical protein
MLHFQILRRPDDKPLKVSSKLHNESDSDRSELLPLCFQECDNTNNFGWERMKVDVSARYRWTSGADANPQLSEFSGSVLDLK